MIPELPRIVFNSSGWFLKAWSQGLKFGFWKYKFVITREDFIFNPLVNPQVQQQPTSNKTLALHWQSDPMRNKNSIYLNSFTIVGWVIEKVKIWVKERVNQPELCLSQQSNKYLLFQDRYWKSYVWSLSRFISTFYLNTIRWKIVRIPSTCPTCNIYREKNFLLLNKFKIMNKSSYVIIVF